MSLTYVYRQYMPITFVYRQVHVIKNKHRDSF